MQELLHGPLDEQTVFAPCYSLNPRHACLGSDQCGLFSLVVEGGEYDVIKAIDFKALNITTLSVEALYNKEFFEPIKKHFAENGYNLFESRMKEGGWLLERHALKLLLYS